MLIFRSEEHVENWCRLWQQPRGAMFPTEQAWCLAQAWYADDRRDPGWRRKTVDEAEAAFKGLGFTSEFWRLR